MRVIRRYPLPIAMGNELAGVVETVGPAVTRVRPGDRVFARVDKDWMGALAELCAVHEDLVARAPTSLDLVTAASGAQALRDEVRVTPGMRLLVTGGAGGVGTFAVQLAKAMGAHVTTTASPRGAALVKSLGADDVVDYTATRLEDAFEGRPFDAAFDTVGGDAATGALRVVKKGGVVVSVAALPEPRTARDLGQATLVPVFWLASFALRRQAAENGVRYRYLFMHPSGSDLEDLAARIDAGAVRVVVDRVFPFAETHDAFAHLEAGRAKGKVLVRVAPAPGTAP